MTTTNLGKVSVTPKGEYDPLIAYERLDIISHNGSSYIVKQASTGVTPIEGEFYALIAEKGDGGSFVKKAYKTYAAMDADKVNIPANSSVDVTNDPDESKNGAYIYDGVAFTRSQYDSKVVTDKIIADTAIAVQDAINNTAVEGGVLADTFVVVDGSLSQRTINKGLESIADLSTINNPKDGLRVYVKSYHAGKGKGGGAFIYDSSKVSVNNNGTIFNGWVRENVVVVSLYDFGAIDNQDVSDVFRSWVDYLGENKNVVGHAVGSFNFQPTLAIDKHDLSIEFKLTLTAVSMGDIGIHFRSANSNFRGLLSVYGSSDKYTSTASKYQSRLIDRGIVISDAKGSVFPEFYVNGTKKYGLSLYSPLSYLEGGYFGNSNMATVKTVKASYCGTLTNWVTGIALSAVNSGSTFNNTQRTTLTLKDSIPEKTLYGDTIAYKGLVYEIMDSNPAERTITVHPHIKDFEGGATFSYLFGGGVHVTGSDSNVVGFDLIDVTSAGVGVNYNSFYGMNLGRLHVSICQVGLLIPGLYGGCVGFLYTESAPIDILVLDSASKGGSSFRVNAAFRNPVIRYTGFAGSHDSISAQNLSPASSAKFASLDLSGSGSDFSAIRVVHKVTPAQRIREGYLLLAKKSDKQVLISGDFSARTASYTSASYDILGLEMHLLYNPTANKASLSYSSKSSHSSNDISIVTCVYENEVYFALDLTASNLDTLTFTGYVDNAESSFVKASGSSVSDVQTLVSNRQSKIVDYADTYELQHAASKTTLAATSSKLSISNSGGRIEFTTPIALPDGLSVFGATPVTTKPVVTGSISGNTALSSLISALEAYGVIQNGTSS